MTKNTAQISLGLLLAVVAWVSIDYFAPDESGSLIYALSRMSLLAMISFAMGGLVARTNFVFPSICFAIAVWVVVVAYSLSIGVELGNSMWSQFVWNLPSLLLVPAVAVGALAGMALAGFLKSKPDAETL